MNSEAGKRDRVDFTTRIKLGNAPMNGAKERLEFGVWCVFEDSNSTWSSGAQTLSHRTERKSPKRM